MAGTSFLVTGFVRILSVSSGKFIQSYVEIISDPYEQINIRQSDAPLIRRDRLSPDMQLQSESCLFDFFLQTQIPYVFTDSIFLLFFHLNPHGRYFFL